MVQTLPPERTPLHFKVSLLCIRNFKRIKCTLPSFVLQFLLPARFLLFYVIETDASSEHFLASASALASRFVIIKAGVGDVCDSTEIFGEMFFDASLFVRSVDRFDDFDGSFEFFCPDLGHYDVVLHFAEVKSGPEVSIEHDEFNNKNYKFLF